MRKELTTTFFLTDRDDEFLNYINNGASSIQDIAFAMGISEKSCQNLKGILTHHPQYDNKLSSRFYNGEIGAAIQMHRDGNTWAKIANTPPYKRRYKSRCSLYNSAQCYIRKMKRAGQEIDLL